MQPLRTDKKPFDQKVKYENATTWLIPKLVGEVKFTEWTSEAESGIPSSSVSPYRQTGTRRHPRATIEYFKETTRWKFGGFHPRFHPYDNSRSDGNRGADIRRAEMLTSC